MFGASVWLSPDRPAPIPDHVYCSACSARPDNAVLTSHDGSFAVSAEPGHYWLVIEKGQFRSEREIDIAAGTTELDAPATTLPSRNDPANGQHIPKIAIAYGNYDAVGDIFAKIGIGTLVGEKDPHSSGVDDGDSKQELTFYSYTGTGTGTVAQLVTNLSELEKFHIVFFPCSTDIDDALFARPDVLANLRRYVADGGKLYVTDWAGEIADRAFPPQIELGGDGLDSKIDSTGDYDPLALTGTLDVAGTADGALYTAYDGAAVDRDLEAWLGFQNLTVEDNWNWIASVHAHDKGGGTIDTPKVWVTGSDNAGHGSHPLAVTYEPTGCGKVLYTTFHTTGPSANSSHAGLMPQERVLLFLIMEIGSCSENPVY